MLWCLTDRKVDMMPKKLIRETTGEEECQKWPLPRATTQSHYPRSMGLSMRLISLLPYE